LILDIRLAIIIMTQRITIRTRLTHTLPSIHIITGIILIPITITTMGIIILTAITTTDIITTMVIMVVIIMAVIMVMEVMDITATAAITTKQFCGVPLLLTRHPFP
jgi:hypothetical protein